MIKKDNNRKRFEREIENFLLAPSLSGTRMKVNRSDFIYFFLYFLIIQANVLNHHLNNTLSL